MILNMTLTKHEKEIIEFSEWLAKRGWTYCWRGRLWNKVTGEDCFNNRQQKTTQGLLRIFQDEKEKDIAWKF